MKKKDYEITEEERKTQDMSVVAEYNGEVSNRAKLVQYEGDDYDDTPVKDESFKGKADNFWYHHKWHVVIAAAVLFVAVISIFQFIEKGKNKTDLSVMYAGPVDIYGEQADGVKEALSEMLSVDLNGDGVERVYLYSFYYLNEQQSAYLTEEAKKNGKIPAFDAAKNRQTLKDYSNLVFTGECGVMFLDGALFEDLKNSGGLEKLGDALGYTPEKTFDGYGVRVCDTAAWARYEALHVMPEDTVVCLRSMSTAGGVMITAADAKENYDAGVRMLKDIFAVSFPKGE